jgi:Na+(H+)/acetate symporter ActP
MHIDPYILTFSAFTVIATIYMGFWSARKSKTASDFFVAGRSVSVGWNASAISGEYLSAASFMGIAGMVMSSGYDALWYPVCYACGYLFLLLFIAGPLRRFGAYTIPDFAEGRFDSPVFRKIAVVFVLFIGFFYTMPQMKGAGTTLAYIFPGLPYWAGVVLVGAVITLNVALGGMKGITLVQAFQYWAKMFAISVPIFVLMAVYGHYGKQVGVNSDQRGKEEQALSKLSWTLDWYRPQNTNAPTLVEDAFQAARLAANRSSYSINTGYEIQVLDLMWLVASNFGFTDFYVERDIAKQRVPPLNVSAWTRETLLTKLKLYLRTNGLSLSTDALASGWLIGKAQNVAAVEAVTKSATRREPLPPKAPADATWLNPFGPLTTKAAKNAAAAIGKKAEKKLSSEGQSEIVSSPSPPSPPSRDSIPLRPGLSPDQRMTVNLDSPTVAQALAIYAELTGRQLLPNTNSITQRVDELLGGKLSRLKIIPRTPISDSGVREHGDGMFTAAEVKAAIEAQLSTNGLALVAVGEKGFQVRPTGVQPQNVVGAAVAPPGIGVPLTGGNDSRPDGNDPRPGGDGSRQGGNASRPGGNDSLLGATGSRPGGNGPRQGGDDSGKGGDDSRLSGAAAEKAWLAKHEKPLALLYTYSLIIAIVCGTAGLPHILVRFYTNPDGVAAKRTTMWVMILIGVFYVFPPVFGVLGRNLLPELYAGVGAKGTDKIVLELPRILNAKYPPLGSILSGITCAGAFAAFMSTFSGLLVSMTGALAHDVYGRILRPKATADERMRMFKIGAVIIGAVAILLGMQVEQLQINFMVGQAFAIAAASYFPLLFMAVWWRKLTMKGAATGMLAGGLLALTGISLTSFSDLKWIDLADFWALHPLLRILCEQPAIWAVPLAIVLMVIVSKLTAREVPADIRMKMLVLHAPEQLGLKQEYIQEHQAH